jgi:alpha-beta hydrolase superfamily lysophospholipase
MLESKRMTPLRPLALKLLHLTLYALAAVGALLAVLLAYLWLGPLWLRARPAPAPLHDYPEAAAAVQQLAAAEGDAVNPLCHTQLLSHGAKTARVVVIFHGISNCPQQFVAVAAMLYARGCNVLLARLPRQGMADRLSAEPAQATAEEAVATGQALVDIAHGLGGDVTVVGMSGGGTLGAWLAQNRPDVDRVVLVAPMFGVQAFPAPLTRPIAMAVRLLPNWWGWFDPLLQDKAPGPQHAYPRYASRTIAEYLRLGAEVTAEAHARPPAVHDIRIVNNLNDESVRPELARAVAAAWQAHGADVFLYEFPTSARLKHDLIDPAQPDAAVDEVYPYLIEVITAQHPPAR